MIPHGRSKSWPTVHLGTLANIQTGKAKGKTTKDGLISVPYLRVANVQDGFIDLSEIKEIEINPAELDRYRLQSGDVLFTEGGDFDKLGRGTVWQGQVDPCLHQNHVFSVRVHKDELLPEFLAYLAASRIGKRYFVSCSKQSTNLASINSTQLKQFPIPLPPLAEQRRITDILVTWDRAVRALDRQINAKAQAASFLRESLVHGNYRLGGDNRPFPVVKLGEVTKHLTARNGHRYGRERVMGVLKADGLVPMKEHVIAADLARYLVVPPSAFAYNPMRINIGSIVMSELDDEVIVSPDYVVFACHPDRCNPRFLNHLRRSRRWQDFMTIAGSGGVRVRIYYPDLAAFEFPLPHLQTQERIVEILDDAQREITILRAERQALEAQRDALASELLTGRLRVRDASQAVLSVG
jgi:type I restriction enzyme, S subunit